MAVDDAFSVPPPTAVPASALDLAKLASGRIVEARIASLADGIALVATRHGLVQLDLALFGKALPNVGDTLRLKVDAAQAGGKPVLTMVEHTPSVAATSTPPPPTGEDAAMVLARSVRDAAAKQTGLAPLYATLAGLASARPEEVPPAVRSLVAQLMNGRLAAAAPPTAEAVKKAFLGSGLFLESRLTNDRAAAPAEDLKAALFSLRSALEKWVGPAPGDPARGPARADGTATAAAPRPDSAPRPASAYGPGGSPAQAYGGRPTPSVGSVLPSTVAIVPAPRPSSPPASPTALGLPSPGAPETSPRPPGDGRPAPPTGAVSPPGAGAQPAGAKAAEPQIAGAPLTDRPVPTGAGGAPLSSPSAPPPPNAPASPPAASGVGPSIASPPIPPISPSAAPPSAPSAPTMPTEATMPVAPTGGAVLPSRPVPTAGSVATTPPSLPPAPGSNPATLAATPSTGVAPSPPPGVPPIPGAPPVLQPIASVLPQMEVTPPPPTTTAPQTPPQPSSPPIPSAGPPSIAVPPAAPVPSGSAAPSLSPPSPPIAGPPTALTPPAAAVLPAAAAAAPPPLDPTRRGEAPPAATDPLALPLPLPAVAAPTPAVEGDDAVMALIRAVVRGLELAGSLTATRAADVGEVTNALAGIGADRDLKPPPPRRGQAPRGQPALPADRSVGDTGVEDLGRRALDRTQGALSRILLEQFAVLDRRPDDPHQTPERRDHREWTVEMPIATRQGTGVVQMTVERDGGRPKGATTAEAKGWRVRFSLDVEPLGPVHAQIGFAGDKLSIGLWAERPDAAARLGGDVGRLRGALEAAAVPVDQIHLATGRPASGGAPASAGHFVDVKL